ncbi:MAG: bifunctional phosphopantothenoylcysteine decarboxylase/phosphopantothenate synthase [Bacteroidales bacterium]|nr:bifunctional phosphopantothenoylcysteine decarboxylase/phosphopantothenate synthase [Bacteroidales bacterium]
MLKGKKIVLGITGSIAAYKACLIIRGLIKKGAEVQVVITPAGKEFITPLTLSTLTQKPVVSEFFSRADGSWHSHVDLGLWADAMLIAPATASTIGKMANGIADNMLITTYLSMKAPVFVAPAMDLDMYAHPSTQHNMQTLQSYGNHIIEAGTGFLASKLEGKGRMEEPEKIIEVLEEFFAKKEAETKGGETENTSIAQASVSVLADEGNESVPQDLKGKRILITAGPTYEKIDPVRFIGNYSSGKMGLALAEECACRGAIVELICGPIQLTTSHPNIRKTDVESAQQMYEASTSLFEKCNVGILCAAVADFTPADVADKKIKREALAEEKGELVLHLKPTQDIAKALGKMKKAEQVLVGFALETNDEALHAKEKLDKKNLDFIVMNSLRDNGAGFRHDTNKITIISKDAAIPFPLKSKKEVATDIVNELAKRL